ncbi:MAG TPA: EAL domain-containing protein [Gaiellaceae bacterium]|nr:EAL domain-containing protein [Gaiellaceae bacterium]
MELFDFKRTEGLASEEALLSRQVWRAIEDESAFGMVFQPIVTLPGRKVVGAEALARFKGVPKRPPNTWFEEAAAASLGVDLELAAVEKALNGLEDFPAALYLSINLSPATLVDPRFRDLVSSADPSRLVLELTEHHRVGDYDRLARAMDKLRADGMRVAIDDAGAGFASLRHILRLRPDFIKLDMSLIREINLDKSKQALAASLISFAEKSDATIIAEGIETAEELSALVMLGVGFGQGMFLGKPASALFLR